MESRWFHGYANHGKRDIKSHLKHDTSMPNLVHDVWEQHCDGMVLHACCFAGPQGDDCRRTLSPGSRLVATFEAGSHFEAMTQYHQLLGREVYTSDQARDHAPYPVEWQTIQRRHLESDDFTDPTP